MKFKELINEGRKSILSFDNPQDIVKYYKDKYQTDALKKLVTWAAVTKNSGNAKIIAAVKLLGGYKERNSTKDNNSNSKKTDLTGIDLHGGDLRGADLSKANLSGVDLSGAKMMKRKK